MENKCKKICIIGLGYVGLPLYELFSKHYDCIGLDISQRRLNEIISEIEGPKCLTTSYHDIKTCDTYIVAVSTPINKKNEPDLSGLIDICRNLSSVINTGSLIIFESTVAPGTTDEICVHLLEEGSGLKLNTDFYVAYSPERVNIGDSVHTTKNTPKIISASCLHALDIVETLYSSVIDAPLIRASSIKVAEATKMYENVQRDVLIALANEFANFCSKENIDIEEVTNCAATKWNFAKVYPGLVGGHCISVDPYYIIDRASQLSITLPLIKTAREVNEYKITSVANRILQLVNNKRGCRVLILGITYKPNIPDCRNSKIPIVTSILKYNGLTIDVYDPIADKEFVEREYKIELVSDHEIMLDAYDIIVQMVNHTVFEDINLNQTRMYYLKDLL